MEDRHCIVQCLRPLSASGQPLQDGVQRSLAAIYDGHNGTRAADTAASRLHMLLAADAALRTHTGGPKVLTEALPSSGVHRGAFWFGTSAIRWGFRPSIKSQGVP